MDPASAIIGIVSFGFTVIGQLNKIQKAIKDAPEQVQALQDSSVVVGLLLSRIQVAGGCSLSRSPQASAYFESLRKRAEDCLKNVDQILKKVIAQLLPDSNGNDKHKLRLNWRRWFMDKGALADLTGKLADVRKALCEMLEFLQVNYLEYIADCVENVELVVNTMSVVQSYQSSRLKDIADRVGRFEHAVNTIVTSTMQAGHFHSTPTIAGVINDARQNPYSSADSPKHEDNTSIDLSGVPHDASHPPNKLCTRRPLKCPPSCTCRCHYPSVSRLIPSWLASYVGQLTISKRLLHPTFSPWSLCNVQTCRGDFQQAATVRWSLPFRILQGFIESRKNCRIHFSIGSPRVVPWDSPIVNAIYDGDLQGVRDLFATGKASIWDYAMGGQPLLAMICHLWRNNGTEQHLEILRFFIEAGAKTLLFEETQEAMSAHDALTGGFFAYLLGEAPDESRSLATIVRTNTAAIHVFRSLLNIDPMDALEDYLDHKRAGCIDVTDFMASLEDTTCNFEGRSSFFQVISHTPLAYAIDFSPESVEFLLANGEDAAAWPYLVYAVRLSKSTLIEPLLYAGADVNMRSGGGNTALLEACSLCHYNGFFELLLWAEDGIDWDACTPDGRNALELLDSAVSAQVGQAPFLSQSQLDEFRAELVDRMDIAEDVLEGQLDMPGAFPDVSYT